MKFPEDFLVRYSAAREPNGDQHSLYEGQTSTDLAARQWAYRATVEMLQKRQYAETGKYLNIIFKSPINEKFCTIIEVGQSQTEGSPVKSERSNEDYEQRR
jgi:hypothetical protein